MSREYTLVNEGLNQWINSPNNKGVCCQTWADTVDELNRLLNHIKRLEKAGDRLLTVMRGEEGTAYCEWVGLAHDAEQNWLKAKEAKP